MVKNFDMAAFRKELEALQVEKVVSSGKFSFGIVNSTGNGKRITINKSLSEKLELTDTVSVLPHSDKNVLVIGKSLPFDSASVVKINGQDKKTCYSAGIVKLIAKSFNIDFSKHVSRSFTNIDIDEIDGIPVAIIDMSKVSGDAA